MAESSLFRNQRQSEYPLQDIVTAATPADASVAIPRTSTTEATLQRHEEDADTVTANPTEVLAASELKAHFEAQVREAFSSGSYENVAVLVISWEKEHDSHLDTSGDIASLRHVVEDEYHFTFREARLYSARNRGVPRLQLIEQVAHFIAAEDGPNKLLLIHYAGHGVRLVQKEDLWPVGKNDAYHEKRLVQLVWDNIVDLLGDHADADILVLLDADEAGRVMKGKGRFRDHQLRKSFAIIGGTPEGESCRAPGEHSLTALTARAFERLLTRTTGFFAEELFEEIQRESKSVSDCKGPLFLQSGNSFSCLRICASSDPFRPTISSSTTSRGHEEVAAALEVQILFLAYPNKDHLTNIVRQFHRAVETRDAPIRQICWQDFSADTTGATKMSSADIAQATLSKIRRRAKARSQAAVAVDTNARRDESSRRPSRRRMSDDTSDEDTDVDRKSPWLHFCNCAAINSVFGAIALGLGAYYFYKQYAVSKEQYDEQMREACSAGGNLVGSRFCEQFGNTSSLFLRRHFGAGINYGSYSLD